MNFKINPVIVLILILFPSCATLFNTRDTSITVQSTKDSTVLFLNQDSAFSLPVEIKVPRSYNDFKIPIRYNSISDSIAVKSILAPEYWYNLALIYFSPIGLLIDASSREKMYSYKKNLLVDFDVVNKSIKKNWYEDKTGQFHFRGSFSEFCYPYLNTDNGKESFDRFMGISLGLDYYLKPRMFLSSDIGSTGISDLPIPVMDREYPDTFNYIGTSFIRVNNNHDLNLVSFGYGLNLSHYRFTKNALDTVDYSHIPIYSTKSFAIGGNFNFILRFFNHLYVSANYIPTFYNFKNHRFSYSHNLFFDIGLRYPVGKNRRKHIPKVCYTPKYLN